jgi:hypothetical protein
MYALADGDVTKMNDVTLIYIEEALTFLCYEKDLNIQNNVKLNANSSRHKRGF